MNEQTNRKLSAKERYSYAVAGFGQNMTITFVNTFLLTVIYAFSGLSLRGYAVLTGIMAAAKVWDAVNDPIIGVLVDRTHTRFGKLRPYIGLSILPVILLTILLFAFPTGWSETARLVFFGVSYVLWDAAYTCCDVPYWAMSGAMTYDPDQRTRLISLARTFGNLGLGVITLLGARIAGAFSGGGEPTKRGWLLAVTAVSVVGMGLFSLAFFNTKERTRDTSSEPSLREIFRMVKLNRPLQLIFLGSILGFGRVLIQVCGSTVALLAFGSTDKFTFMGAAILVSMIAATVACPAVLRRVGKRTLMIASSFFSAAFYLAIFFVPMTQFWVVCAMIFFTGFSLGFFTVLQTAMIADSADYMEDKTGVRSEGVCFSALTFTGKLMNALGTLAFMLIMLAVGYADGVPITAEIKRGAMFAISIVPAVSCIVGTIPFFFYRDYKRAEK